MTLSAGTQFGAFRVTNLLGVGGMGEVYRAHDTKLDREVALKVLPAAFRSDSERLGRFAREARALAALNHPNIATIHGLEEHAGVHALVLELVEGDTLAERIAGRRLPVAETLDIARQLVDALDAAHARGLVHRDLKPANIKVTGSGLVKVLDFGLAKAMDPTLSDSGAIVDLTQSPTISSGSTGTGVILGTAAYMSPEQARGKALDKRADIWAFGCVVYEMLTGRMAFPGDTLSDTIVAILDRAPDWSAVPSGTPSIVVKLLRRCLEKDARRRLRDIGDARHDFDDAFNQPEHDTASAGAVAPDRRVVFQRITDMEGVNEAPAISPDGKMVAFAAVVAGKRQIWIRLLSGGAPLQLTRDDADHLHPRWAPDSSTLIYFTPSAGSDTGTIWEIGALGGWPRRLASSIGAGDISHDGQRVAMLQLVDDQVSLVLTARDGSRASRLALLPPSTYSRPLWAPDDRSIAVQRLGQNAFDGHIEVIDVASGERSEVVSEAWLQGFAWLPDGSGFVYGSSRDSSILYPPVFNLRVVRRDGSANRQLTYGDHSYVDPDVHASGKLVAGRITSRSDVWKVPVGRSPVENARAALRITRQTGQVRVPSVSPDEREVVFVSDSGGHANLWIAATDGSAARPITFETDPAVSFGVPLWSPRGDVIAFVRIESAQGALWGVGPDGSTLRQLVRGWAPCFSADGAWLYYWRLDVEPGRIERMPIDGGPAEIIRDGTGTTLTAISPDGSTLFFLQPIRESVGHFGSGLFTFDRASPPGGPAETIARITGVRMPERLLTLALSPDGRHLATFLLDGAATNIWLLPTDGGPMKPVTDFGDRSVTMTRSMSWSRDSQHIYAALAETQTDIILLDGLLERGW